jgi:protoporphyrinogen/coproporphyrinogen III oxidase
MAENHKIAIIGGGVSGLTAAFEFAAQNVDFVLLEAEASLGGIIKTESRDGFLLEHGPDAFLSEKPEVLELAEKLGIENELIQTNDRNRRSFLVRENRLRAVPEGFYLIAPADLQTFFQSEILSALGKVRLANERYLPAAPPQEDESLAAFVRRRFGLEALERVAQPMIGGIYAADPEKLSLRATQPRFLDLEQKYGSVIEGIQKAKGQNAKDGTSGARYSMFLSFKKGMQTLTDALAAALPQDSIRLNARVEALRFDESKRLWEIKNNSETFTANAVILNLPAHVSAKLLGNQFPALGCELAEIEHASTATINFAFRREQIQHALDGFGFVVPFAEKRTVMACTFSSVKFDCRAPRDHVLLRAFVGGALQSAMFNMPDDEMISEAFADLRQLLRIEGEPLFAVVARWRNSMPQYHVGHLKRVEKIKNLLSAIPSLQLATTALDGVGIPDSVRRGARAAENVVAFGLNK